MAIKWRERHHQPSRKRGLWANLTRTLFKPYSLTLTQTLFTLTLIDKELNLACFGDKKATHSSTPTKDVGHLGVNIFDCGG